MNGTVEVDADAGTQDPQQQGDITTGTSNQNGHKESIVRALRDVLGEVQVVHPIAEDSEVLKEEGEDQFGVASYWDAETMAPLNARSAAAIARLRAFKPPPAPLWDRLHVSRRAAVLLLLFADRRGDLRVVITMRAASLRSFSGHAALPGGKADSVEETPFQIARREADEEIGLPQDDSKLPSPFRIEHLCDLPMNLARTELIVRPCVAFLHTTSPASTTSAPSSSSTSTSQASAQTSTADETLIPRLDAKEVAAVFSAPFHNFLLTADEVPTQETNPSGAEKVKGQRKEKPLPEGKWYEGSWLNYNNHPWRAHYFYVPVNDQKVMKPRRRMSIEEVDVVDELAEKERFMVWGMTAHMLVDAARIAYGEEPEFEYSPELGDEKIIADAEREGRLGPKEKKETPKV